MGFIDAIKMLLGIGKLSPKKDYCNIDLSIGKKSPGNFSPRGSVKDVSSKSKFLNKLN